MWCQHQWQWQLPVPEPQMQVCVFVCVCVRQSMCQRVLVYSKEWKFLFWSRASGVELFGSTVFCGCWHTKHARQSCLRATIVCAVRVSLLTSKIKLKIKYTENAKILHAKHISFLFCVCDKRRPIFFCNSSIYIKVEFKSNLRSHQRIGYSL